MTSLPTTPKIDTKKQEKARDEIIEKGKKVLETREERIRTRETKLMEIEDKSSTELENRTRNTLRLLRIENDKKVFRSCLFELGRKSI